MQLSVSDYETGSLTIYIIEDKHELNSIDNLEEVVNKLGHNSTNCEWFVFEHIEKKLITD
tara:strand:- start:2116 stop:2295 length:180 start_codon:yes stop_codon:yes gene_type:complete